MFMLTEQGHLFEFCKFYLYFIVIDLYNNEYFSLILYSLNK